MACPKLGGELGRAAETELAQVRRDGHTGRGAQRLSGLEALGLSSALELELAHWRTVEGLKLGALLGELVEAPVLLGGQGHAATSIRSARVSTSGRDAGGWVGRACSLSGVAPA